MSLRVGYVGLGIMGSAMARNIIKGGFPVVVWNRSAAKMDALVAEGATAATSPAHLASQVDVVFTNLSDSPDVLGIVFGKDGIAEGIRSGAILVDNSTIKPSAAREIYDRLKAEKGVETLDAPVSGGELGARNGTLTIMVGGEDAVLQRVMPVFKTMGKSVTLIGGPGAGQVAKAANQIMVAAQMVAEAELLVFAQKAGVDPEKVVNAIKGGAAQCWTLDNKPQRIFAGVRTPGFKAQLQSKDLGIVMDSAKEFGVPLPSTAVNAQLFQSMVQQGMGDLDNSAVLNVLEQLAGCQIPAPNAPPKQA